MRYIASTILFIVCASLVAVFVLPHIKAERAHKAKVDAGWCEIEKRFLTNDEVINSAIDYLVRYRAQSPEDFDPNHHKFDSSLPKYANVEEFSLKNKACCRQAVHTDKPEKYLKNFGNGKRATFPNGMFFYFSINEGDTPSKPDRITLFSITACGKIIGATDHNNQRLKFVKK